LSGNQIKTIACVTMLIDHIGFLLFPKLVFLRYIGRISMPLFAFLIAEGCRYTRSKSRYFASVFSLAVLCQLVYLAEDLLDGTLDRVYLNILFTFSLSILICFAYLRWNEAASSLSGHGTWGYLFLLFGALTLAIVCCTQLDDLFGIPVVVDYGIAGVFLPVFAIIFADKERQLPLYTVGVAVFALLLCEDISYIWFSLLTIPLIACYSGLRGKKQLKLCFYLFYPVHFAILYLIKMIAF